ncbi:outer membrane beta-barrel protein [Dysgonomonas sp. BGC7]|uniref:outer membrane beta-barrel protein n=1 Tax=Dysgonomonas sp. BGC7 TaxID=1658008 RepID=UPI0012FBF3C1|nr:outer membrane beta-barrel protein [Dysgonomonas sp. BGC7]MBD8389422.1 outer membrane beta-barrel protein [Dysgonomonas sp. BGC7]
MKRIITSTLLLAFCLYTLAQDNYTVFGVKLSIGSSKYSGMDKYENAKIIPGSSLKTIDTYSSDYYPAWDLGLILQVMRNNLMIQADYSFACTNTKLNNAYINKTDRLKRIRNSTQNLVINLGTKIPISEDFRLIAGLGPYIGFDYTRWMTGSDSYKIEGGSTSLPIDGILDTEDADYHNFDFGGSVLIGVEHKNIQLSFNYMHGLTNIVKDEFPLYNRSYKLGLIYFF